MEQPVRSGMPHVTAVYTQGKLLLAARGTSTDQNDPVTFEPESLFTVPPRFLLRRRTDSHPATGTAAPYQVAMLFAVGSPPDEVVVRFDGGDVRVPVLVAADGEAISRRETVPLVRISASRSADGRTLIPAVFEEMLAEVGEDVATPLLWPIRLGPLFQGRLEPADADPRRAIGYSGAFDFNEAFQDALRNLPLDTRGGADRLTTVHVTGAGALLGGSAGGQRLFVSILAY